MLEPLALVIVTWLKIKCAIDSWRRAPNEEEVLEAIAQREENKRESNSNPYVTVVMPIYNEPIESLMIAINSVTEVQYPLHRLHLVLAFDSDHVSTLYRAVIYCLQANKADIDYVALSTSKGMDEIGDIGNDFPAVGDIMYRGLMVTPCRFVHGGKRHAQISMLTTGNVLDEIGVSGDGLPAVGVDIMFRGLKVTPCRFVHGGKRHAQMCAFRYLSDLYAALATKPLLLFIDSDIELDALAIAHFTYEMMGQTGVYRDALTGLITCKTAGTYSFLKVLQDTEYVESQMLQRNAEDYLGVASIYFGNMDAVDRFDFNRTHLGEDRYLTHLLMERCADRYRIGFCPSARCKTEGCDSFRSLLKQRRRWYLGTLMNEVYQLASPILWRQYPGLNGLIGLSALRNGPLFVYVLFLQLMHGQGTWYSYAYAQRRRWYLGTLMNEVYQLASPILWRQYPGLNGLIGLSALRNGPLFVYVLFLQLMHGQGTWYSYAYAVSVFGAIWMFVIAAGFKIGRLKIAWFYPVVLVCLPVMAAVFQVYGMLTFNVRTWGGPRTAADRASESALDEVVIMPKHDLPQAIADDQEPIGDGDHAAMMGSPM
ncbi:hypothetical protein PBRA_006893 [Plasmodiophora brassicae]|uniref:chitin synthase n=1 Tax=Plasmodiophora brassicae TaxID=37360 RepID=A0A0G4IUG9_PLABS|nr:hypothetical protein PBRA_006893 [Plasmodiophora brassicae]